MADAFSLANAGIESCPLGSFPVTPNNDANLPEKIRQITIGGNGGIVVYDGWDGLTYDTGILPQGSYPMFAQRIRVSGTTAIGNRSVSTTATGITGWI
jgi:hypothetical protein